VDESQRMNRWKVETNGVLPFWSRTQGKPVTLINPVAWGLEPLSIPVVWSGTGLSLRRSLDATYSITAKPGVVSGKAIAAVNKFFEVDDVNKALKDFNLAPLPRDMAAKFAGRPRFTARLIQECLIMDKAPADVALELFTILVNEFVVDPLADAKDASVSGSRQDGDPKNLIHSLVAATFKYVSGGPGFISLDERAALYIETGLCALAPPDNKTHGGMVQVTLREPMVIASLLRFGDMRIDRYLFENSAEDVGHDLEYALVFHANEVCQFVSHELEKLVQGAQDEKEKQAMRDKFGGPWTLLREKDSMERRGVAMESTSKEADVCAKIAELLACVDSSLPGVVLTDKPVTFGPDVVIVAKRPSDGRRLVIFVQARAQKDTSTPGALKVCEKALTPAGMKKLLQPHGVVFMVVKYPANSRESDRGTRVGHDGHARIVMDEEVIIEDARSGNKLFPGLEHVFNKIASRKNVG
jgi:hypothetical protein